MGLRRLEGVISMDYSDSNINPDLLIRYWRWKGKPDGWIKFKKCGIIITIRDTIYGEIYLKWGSK